MYTYIKVCIDKKGTTLCNHQFSEEQPIPNTYSNNNAQRTCITCALKLIWTSLSSPTLIDWLRWNHYQWSNHNSIFLILEKLLHVSVIGHAIVHSSVLISHSCTVLCGKEIGASGLEVRLLITMASTHSRQKRLTNGMRNMLSDVPFVQTSRECSKRILTCTETERYRWCKNLWHTCLSYYSTTLLVHGLPLIPTKACKYV